MPETSPACAAPAAGSTAAHARVPTAWLMPTATATTAATTAMPPNPNPSSGQRLFRRRCRWGAGATRETVRMEVVARPANLPIGKNTVHRAVLLSGGVRSAVRLALLVLWAAQAVPGQ